MMVPWRVLALVIALAAAGCGSERAPAVVQRVAGGDAALGPEIIRRHGCHACHDVGAIGAHPARVGPPLAGYARRAYIAGALPNEPENLVRWIQDPQGVLPGTAMPVLGVTEAEARHIAAYLYSLR